MNINGVSSDGFKITAQPAAIAQTHLTIGPMKGKIHGVIAYTTLTGDHNTKSFFFYRGLLIEPQRSSSVPLRRTNPSYLLPGKPHPTIIR